MLIDLLRSDGSIIANKNLVHAIGLNAAIFYSELVSKRAYFEGRDQLTEDGYFFNTVDNMKLDTGLGEKPQKAAIKKLETLGLIKMELRGIPAIRHFKIIDNEELVMNILSEGKQIREELKLELEEKSKKKRAVYTNHINSTAQREELRTTQKEELEQPKGSLNNTKFNNTKNNNNIYIISEENDGVVFKYYSKRYKEHFGKDHPTMNKDKIEKLRYLYSDITTTLDIDGEERWIELVDYHFDNLPTKNNGNILAFIDHGVIYRYLEETTEEWLDDDWKNADLDKIFPS